MGSAGTQTWLEKLEEQLNVDVDTLNHEWISKFPIKAHDQTSNQLWVDDEMGESYNADLLAQTTKDLKEQGWLAIYTRMAVLMCKKNIDLISGRVLLQTLPSKAYDTEATLAHGRLYDQEFRRAGIGRDRYCIKIPSTGPALNAAKILSREDGIPTLGTALFGLPQAIACSQAGCLYISPYFNETRAHDELKLWPDVEDPATQHPNSARVYNIIEVYRKLYKETGEEQPFVKNASFISPKEAMAAGEMGCHSATISPQVLDQLAKMPYDGTKQPGEGVPKPQHVYASSVSSGHPNKRLAAKLARTDPLSVAGWDESLADTSVDYLGNGGSKLDEAIAKDPVAKSRLEDALKLFTGGEMRSKEKVERVMGQI